MKNFDAGIFFGVLIGNFARIISGAVIDEDDLEVLIGLINNRIETFFKIFGSIVDWNDYGNKIVIFHWRPSFYRKRIYHIGRNLES